MRGGEGVIGRRAWGWVGKRGEGRTPMQKAPPKSLRATQGQGSREWSIGGRRGGEGGGEAVEDGGGGRGGVRQVETDEVRWLLRQLEKVEG